MSSLGSFLRLGWIFFFFPNGLYTVMYIDSYVEAAAAAVCTWGGWVLFSLYLCCKEKIINNFPGCMAAGLRCGGCIFLWLLELRAGFNWGLADELLLLGPGSAGAEMLEAPWAGFSPETGRVSPSCRGHRAPFAGRKAISLHRDPRKANRAAQPEQTAAGAAAGGRLHRACAAESAPGTGGGILNLVVPLATWG